MPNDLFQVKTAVFEGPLDLLLSLIEKRKLLINDISLSQVTNDYIEYVKQIQSFPIADSAQFIVVASTLLLIKSKSLLPTLELTSEEQASVSDLEQRLKVLGRMRELSRHIKERFGKAPILIALKQPELQPVFSPDASITTSGLLQAIRDMIRSIPVVEAIPKALVKKVISLEEMIHTLTDRITQSIKMSFKEFSGGHVSKETRVNVIVSFLAMLELVKQGVIHVTQEHHLSDIYMETPNVSVPRYD